MFKKYIARYGFYEGHASWCIHRRVFLFFYISERETFYSDNKGKDELYNESVSLRLKYLNKE